MVRGVDLKVRNLPPPTCAKDGEIAKLVTGREVYPLRRDLHSKLFYRCQRCGDTVGCHPGTSIPLGALADKATRRSRMEAHAAFDAIWKSDKMGRRHAYGWLAKELGIDFPQCHIGQFNFNQCKRTIEICERFGKENG